MDAPHYLYKFRDLQTTLQLEFTKRILVDNQLYVAAPATLNDPCEFRLNLSFEATRKEKIEHIQNLILRYEPQTRAREARLRAAMDAGLGTRFGQKATPFEQEAGEKMLDAIRREAGVLSLAATCVHPLLWSHYAGGSTGICIGFEPKSDPLFLGKAQPMSYQDEFPVGNYYSSSEEELVNAVCLTKSKEWSYESEWRYVEIPDPFNDGHGESRRTRSFEARALARIVLGARISEQNETTVREWMNNRDVPPSLFRAVIRKDEYGLDLVEL